MERSLSKRLLMENQDYKTLTMKWFSEKSPINLDQTIASIIERDKSLLIPFVRLESRSGRKTLDRIFNRMSLKTEICFLKNSRFSSRKFQICSMRNAIFCINEHKNLLDVDDKNIIKQTITEELFSDLLEFNNIVMFGNINKIGIKRFNDIMHTTIKSIISDRTTSTFITYYNSNIGLLYKSTIVKWQQSENVQTFLPFLCDYTNGLVDLKIEKKILQHCIETSQDSDKENIQSILERINAKIAIGNLLALIETNENSKRSLSDYAYDWLKYDILPDLLKKLRLQSGIAFFSFRDIYLMNQIIKIKNHLAILDQFDKAEIAHSLCLFGFLTKCTTQENWAAIEKNLADPKNQFLIACLDVKNEITRIRKEIADSQEQRTINRCKIMTTCYPYPDNHFTEIIAQIHIIQSQTKEKFRSKNEIESLEWSLSEYERLLHSHIEWIIKRIKHTGSSFYKYHGLSHDEWTKKIATYFPQDNPELVKLLTEKGYQPRIDAKLAQLAETEKQIAAREQEKKEREKKEKEHRTPIAPEQTQALSASTVANPTTEQQPAPVKKPVKNNVKTPKTIEWVKGLTTSMFAGCINGIA